MNNYINCGNIFARYNQIEKIIENKSFLIITQEENILKYKKIFFNNKINLIEIDTLDKLIDFVYNKNGIYIINSSIFFAKLNNIYEIENHKSILIEKNKETKIENLTKKIADFGYKYQDFLEESTYKKFGENFYINLSGNNFYYHISFWGDEVENIYKVENEKNIEVNSIRIGEKNIINYYDLGEKINLETINLLKNSNIIIDNLDIIDDYDLLQNNKNWYYLEILKNNNHRQTSLDNKDLFIEDINQLTKILKNNKLVNIYTKSISAVNNYLDYNNIEEKNIIKTPISFLKSYENKEEIFLCDDIISKIFVKKRIKRNLSENIDLMLQIKPGDYVVHIDHGIGVFNEICDKTLGDITRQYIEIEYKNNDKLFVPITEIKRISKYIGKENPSLTGLSTKEWTKKIQKAGIEAEIIAGELLEIYAQRKIKKGFSFNIDKTEISNFQNSFEYVYTNDQNMAILDILEDMSKNTPMDRILVGDVGFGKTEVAFNAVYNAILNKKQAAIVSPLVVLAYEHYSKALERFSKFGINIEVLTRFESKSQEKIVLEKLKNGKIDLIIGTHKLLSENIVYKDLGILIIDEEHKFGVGQKEQIQKFKNNIDVLSMSATPIPRSLNMALNGIKDVSILQKAPDIRKGVETYVSKFDENMIKIAGENEFNRGGQLFFIHNRVSTIENMSKIISEIFPNKKIVITHGQLTGHELENRILAFKQKKYDILISSTVIENGIDFPNVNTIFINDAYKFGISQLHQLRGRVGRSDKIGYCYLLFKKDKLKNDGLKRLQTMVEYSHLGAGFELAIKDLEIRGGGDILGIKQSGNATEIGVNVFLKMLEEKIEEIKLKSENKEDSKKIKKKIDTIVDLNIGAFLDNNFFYSELDKINFYREIEYIGDIDDLENLEKDFVEINGELKNENKNLFDILKLRIIANKYKIKSIKRAGVSFEIIFDENIEITDLKKFLDIDAQKYFIVSDLSKIKTPARNFKKDEDFMQYILKNTTNNIKINDNGRKVIKLTKN
ncbi:MAG: DEAD/DEAH box helicase [Candidatus Gracilibacteria bacterium]|nr:DEAD/DEAH box helicase [Candidatus Gracilibacteria bacterium]